MVILMSF